MWRLNCKAVAGKIAREEFAEAGWRERLAIMLHLLHCRNCRLYLAQQQKIAALARALLKQNPDPADLKRLQRQILDALHSAVQKKEGDADDSGGNS